MSGAGESSGQLALVQLADTLTTSWRELAGRGLLEGSLAFAVLLVLWLPLRRRLSPRVVSALFLLPLIRVALPFGLPLPEWVPTLSFASLWSSAPAPVVYRAVAGLDLLALPLEQIELPPPPPFWSLERALFVGWVCGVALLSLRFARAQWRTHRAVRAAQPVVLADFPLDLEALRRRAGVRRRVRWFATDAVASPAAGGLLRPYVLLPRGFAERLSAPQLTFVLLHELAHVRRGDVAVALAQRLLQIFWFFHPAVWFASWLIDQHRELACDQEAIARSGASRRVCGEAFLAVAEWVHGRTSLPTATLAMFDPNRVLRRRLMQILNDHPKSSRLLTATYLLFAAAVTLPAARADSGTMLELGVVAQDQAQDAQREQIQELRKALAELRKQQAALAKQIAELDQAKAELRVEGMKLGEAGEALEVEGHKLDKAGKALAVEGKKLDRAKIAKGMKPLQELPVLGRLFATKVDGEDAVVQFEGTPLVEGLKLDLGNLAEVRRGRPVEVDEVAEVEGHPVRVMMLRDGKVEALDIEGDEVETVAPKVAKAKKAAKVGKASGSARTYVIDDSDGKREIKVLIDGEEVDVKGGDGVLHFEVDGDVPPGVMKVLNERIRGVEGKPLKVMKSKAGKLVEGMPLRLEFDGNALALPKGLKFDGFDAFDKFDVHVNVDVDCEACEDAKPAKSATKAKKAKVSNKAKKAQVDECEACDEACEECEVEVKVEADTKSKADAPQVKVIRAKKAIGV